MPTIRLRSLLIVLCTAVAVAPEIIVAGYLALFSSAESRGWMVPLLSAALIGAISACVVAFWLSNRIALRTNAVLSALSGNDPGNPEAALKSYVAEINELGQSIKTIVAGIRQRAIDLDEANAVFAETFKQSLLPLALTKPPGGVFIDVSESWAAAFGYPRELIVGKPARELDMFVDTEDFDRISRELAAAGIVRDYQARVRTASGKILTVLVSCLPLRINHVDSVLTSFLDITDKIAADNARIETEQRYRIIVEAMAEGVVVHHHDLSIVSCNKAAEHILGVTEAQLRGEQPIDPTWRVIAADGSRLAEEEYPSTIAIRAGVPCLGQHLVVIRPDGSKREISINAMPMEATSLGGRGALVTIADRTSEFEAVNALQSLAVTLEDKVQQRTVELEDAISELKAFSYSVSHDLRAPLRAIDGFAQLLNERHGGELSPEAQRHLDRVLLSAKRMNIIIDDLLLLSRVTQADLTFTKVDISGIAWSVIEQLKEGSARRVEWQVEPGIVAYGDAGLLKVLLENLLGNAWKYSAKTADARIALRAAESTSAESVTFMVEDNGAGFDQQYVGQLFSPFRRLHAESEFPGSGIGLATVKRVVARHGGTARAEGAVGRGAKFWISLPKAARTP